MELGGQHSPNSFSSSSFDSCSDLLSLVDKPSRLPGSDDFGFVYLPSPQVHEILIDPSPRNSRLLIDVPMQNNTCLFTSDSQGDGKANEETHIEDVKCTNRAAFSTLFSDSDRPETGTGMIEHEMRNKNVRIPRNRSGLDLILESERRASSASVEADGDLRQLENSIKLFDLNHKSALLPQPYRSISGRYSYNDIHEFKESDAGNVAHNAQTHRRSSSYDKMKDSDSFEKEQQASTDLLSWLNYEDSKKNGFMPLVESSNCLIDTHKNRMISLHFDDISDTTGSSGSSSDGKALALAQALINRDNNDHSHSYGKLLSKKPSTKTLSDTRVEENLRGVATLDLEDLGPDEIGRYLEPLDVNETYLDAKTINADIDDSNAELGSNLSTDDGQLFSSSEPLLPPSSCFLPANEIPFTVNSVEVVEARQQRGGSSMWQRMVGVKDHTVYCIKVVSGKHEWEVQRRYRDFLNFHRQLRQIFAVGGGTSSMPFSIDIENLSHRVLGNISPTVVEARVICIEKFLVSLLQAGPPYSTATPVFWFLRPPQGAFENTGFEEHLMVHGSTLHKNIDVQLGTLNISTMKSQSIPGNGKEEHKVPCLAGKTMKLVLNIHENRSLKERLNIQHYSCAGCYRHVDYEKGLIHGFAQAFGQGKPRFCEYTGQVFCSSCHLNELAVVPAYVLWHWDFTQKRVCQVAKAYLDSIFDQPLLCVSTANPYLYQRVPCLSNVQESRAKLSRVLSCMRCPFHSHILTIMGSRRYLLEKNDIFALRDLEDLSKGAFAVLPGLLKLVLKTLMLHVTKQCSICQDSGEWCGAGILCEDPFQPIFPFNEEINVVNCKVCNAPFHEDCLAKCPSCPSCPKNWVGMNPLKASLAV